MQLERDQSICLAFPILPALTLEGSETSKFQVVRGRGLKGLQKEEEFHIKTTLFPLSLVC